MDPINQMVSRHIPTELEEQNLGAANAALKSAEEEDFDRALEILDTPEQKQEKERERRAQEAKEAHEITELERTNDEITAKFAQLLIMDLIKLHPKLGEVTPTESYTQVLDARYQDLITLIRDRYKDRPDVSVEGLSLVIFSKTLEVLNASQSLDTAKRIFMTQHHFEGTQSEDETPLSSDEKLATAPKPTIASTPFASTTSFQGHSDHVAAQPAMFRLSDLQQQEISHTPPKEEPGKTNVNIS